MAQRGTCMDLGDILTGAGRSFPNACSSTCCGQGSDTRMEVQNNKIHNSRMPSRPSAIGGGGVVAPANGKQGRPLPEMPKRSAAPTGTPPQQRQENFTSHYRPQASASPTIPVSLSLSRDEMCRIVSRSRICQGLARSKLHEILHLMKHIKTSEGMYVVNQGQEATSLLFVLSGQISVDVQGRPVATLTKGDFVGESALCNAVCGAGVTLRSADCRALTDVELVELDAQSLLPILHTIPELVENMRGVVSGVQQMGATKAKF